MLEAQIKNDYKLGNRKGITELDDFFYMPVRITGSGLNFRKLDDTIIVADRSKGEFFNEAFLEHCKTLPIIVEHPTDENGEKDMLHTDTLPKNAIVGNTIDAWIDETNDDEIWGLARIYDKSILDKIKNGIINSTSPGIRIFYKETDPDFKTETPYVINHLAFCEKGHWDKDDGRKAIDTSEFSKIDLTFDSNFDILQKKEQEESSMVAEKLDNTETKETEQEVSTKANDSTNEQEVANKVSAMKANDAEEKEADEKADEKKDAETKDEAEKDDEKGEKANDADIGLSKAASLMAKASHAGIEKKEEKPVETVKDEGQKTEETKTETEEKEAPKETKPQKTNDSEAIDSETETEDDKKRDDEIKEMRKVCDSADANLNVKMPFISGRQTYRAVAHKFVQANKQFLDKKYANLTLDSYTPELAKEVLESVYSNIRKESKIDDKPVKVGGYVRMPDGTLCDPDF